MGSNCLHRQQQAVVQRLGRLLDQSVMRSACAAAAAVSTARGDLGAANGQNVFVSREAMQAQVRADDQVPEDQSQAKVAVSPSIRSGRARPDRAGVIKPLNSAG